MMTLPGCSRRWAPIGAVACGALGAGGACALGDLEWTDQVAGAFVDISATGTPLGLGDEGVAEIACGFDLTLTLFAGDGSGRVWVSSNGAMGFLADGGAGAFWENQQIPSFALFGHGGPQALAVYWDDLSDGTGDIYYETAGDPGTRVLIVQWHQRPHYPGDGVLDGNECTVQAQIFESGAPGHAQLIYQDVDFSDPALDNGASATIGYQSGGHGPDLMWSYNSPGAVTAGTVLTLIDTDCPPDMNGDGLVNSQDFILFLNLFTAGDPLADFNGDGQINSQDFIAFLNAFVAGC